MYIIIFDYWKKSWKYYLAGIQVVLNVANILQIIFVRDGIHSVADYNSTLMGVVVKKMWLKCGVMHPIDTPSRLEAGKPH